MRGSKYTLSGISLRRGRLSLYQQFKQRNWHARLETLPSRKVSDLRIKSALVMACME